MKKSMLRDDESAIAQADQELKDFNNRFPTAAIELDTIGTSLEAALKEQAESIGGSDFNIDLPVMADIQERRIAQESK